MHLSGVWRFTWCPYEALQYSSVLLLRSFAVSWHSNSKQFSPLFYVSDSGSPLETMWSPSKSYGALPPPPTSTINNDWSFPIDLFSLSQKSRQLNDTKSKAKQIPRRTKPHCSELSDEANIKTTPYTKNLLFLASLLLNVYFLVSFTDWPQRILHSLRKISGTRK